MGEYSFSLVDEPWIAVVERGMPRLRSLMEALLQAHEIDTLSVANPLETVAMLRQVLLPAYLDACGIPTSEAEWQARWDEGTLPAVEIKKYLGEHRQVFDLFGARPFGQVAGLRTAKDETKPVSLLIATTATGNNVPLFAARTEADPPSLTPAEATRAMLATQCWDTAAIKSGAADDEMVSGGKTTGNPTGPCGALGVIVPLGRNLAETILLNTPIVGQPDPEDLPQWRSRVAPTGAWRQDDPKGLLHLLTWQSRRVRLVPERIGGEIVVRRVVLTAGDRIRSLPQDVEPHTAWRQVDKPRAGQPSVTPVRHVIGRDSWRGLEPMLATVPQASTKVSSSLLLSQLHRLQMSGHLGEDLPLQVMTVGVAYGNQSAVVEDVIADLLPLPMAALHPDSDVRQVIETVMTQAEGLRRAGNNFGDDLRRAGGGHPLPWDKGFRLGDALMHDFNRVVRRLLADMQRQPELWERAEEAWQESSLALAHAAAERALSAIPPTAFLGRTDKGGKRTTSASVAHAWYRAAVRKTLGI